MIHAKAAPKDIEWTADGARILFINCINEHIDISIFDGITGKFIETMHSTLHGCYQGIIIVECRPYDSYLALKSNRTCEIWDMRDKPPISFFSFFDTNDFEFLHQHNHFSWHPTKPWLACTYKKCVKSKNDLVIKSCLSVWDFITGESIYVVSDQEQISSIRWDVLGENLNLYTHANSYIKVNFSNYLAIDHYFTHLPADEALLCKAIKDSNNIYKKKYRLEKGSKNIFKRIPLLVQGAIKDLVE